jgi:hypothetical protein
MNDSPEPTTALREEQAWMLQSVVNPFPVSGALALESGRISFTLDAKAADASVGWLEKELGIEDIPGTIRAGGPVVAFDLAVADVEVSWPLTLAKAGMKLNTEGRDWIVSFDYPSAGGVVSVLFMSSGRKKAKAWKAALGG